MGIFKFNKDVELFEKENNDKIKDVNFDDLFTNELFYQIRDNLYSKEILEKVNIDKFNKEFTTNKIRETIYNILSNDTLWEIVNQEINDLFWECAG